MLFEIVTKAGKGGVSPIRDTHSVLLTYGSTGFASSTGPLQSASAGFFSRLSPGLVESDPAQGERISDQAEEGGKHQRPDCKRKKQTRLGGETAPEIGMEKTFIHSQLKDPFKDR